MEIKDIMSKNIITSNINDDISIIANKMRNYDIGFIPIIDKNHIIGIITDRDIACRIFNNEDPEGDITEYMSRDIISTDIDSSIPEALNLMKKHRIKRIIIKEQEKIVGILSISDILPINEYKNETYETIKEIWKIGPNKHKYETEIDEFYL